MGSWPAAIPLITFEAAAAWVSWLPPPFLASTSCPWVGLVQLEGARVPVLHGWGVLAELLALHTQWRGAGHLCSGSWESWPCSKEARVPVLCMHWGRGPIHTGHAVRKGARQATCAACNSSKKGGSPCDGGGGTPAARSPACTPHRPHCLFQGCPTSQLFPALVLKDFLHSF